MYPIVGAIVIIPALLLLPLGMIFFIFKRTRGLGGMFWIFCSLLFLTNAWTHSLASSYAYFGKIIMILGVLIAGIGVFPLAIVGGIIRGDYMDSLMICIWLIIVFIMRAIGFWMISSADEKMLD